MIITLSLKERNELISFAQMTRFGLKERDHTILKNLLKEVKGGEERKENDIWALLLNEDERKDIRKIRSRLFGAAKDYIIYKSAEGDSLQSAYLRARYYSKHGIIKNFQAVFREIFKKINELKRFNNGIYAFWMYEMQVALSKETRKPKGDASLMLSSLDDFYAVQKARLLAEEINRSIIHGDKQKVSQHLGAFKKLRTISDAPLLNIYEHAINLFIHDTNDSYLSLEKHLNENLEGLAPNIIQELSIYLLNYFIRRVNNGEIEYVDKYFELLTKLEEKGLFKENNRLEISRLQNLVSLATLAEKHELAHQLVQKFEAEAKNDRLLERKPFVSLYKSLIMLSEGDSDSARDFAIAFRSSNVYLKDVYHRLICDKILIKIYFLNNEMQMIKIEKVRIDSYLRKKKFPPERSRKHIVFFNILMALGRDEKIILSDYKDQLLISDYTWLKKQNLGS
ncbi:MAG: hypothetical protein AAF741_17425 [Bacteroidota bacterium]